MNSYYRNNQHRARPLLGTVVEISAEGACHQTLQQAICEAFKVIEKVQRLMSFHDPQSELSQLNQFAFQKSVCLHPWTLEVLKTASEISQKTNGLFDCTIAPSLMRLGYLPKEGKLITKTSTGNFRDIIFLKKNQVRFKRPLWIDLGGIAKGFAVDKAVQVLKSAGIPEGYVNAGGDLRVFGPKEQTVFIRNPNAPGTFYETTLAPEKAMATSAIYFSRKKYLNQKVSPIIHPLCQTSCLPSESVSVIASSCIIADALTKPVLLSSAPEFILKKFRVQALIWKREKSRKEFVHAA